MRALGAKLLLAGLFVLQPLILNAQFATGRGLRPADPHAGKRWGLVDSEGRLALPYTYTSLQASEGGAILARREDGKIGILRPDGTPASPFQYDGGHPMFGGLLVVTLGGFQGAYDGRGSLLLEPRFDEIGPAQAELIPVIHRRVAGWFDARTHTYCFPRKRYDEFLVLGDDLVIGLDKGNHHGVGYHRNGEPRWEMALADWPTRIDDQTFRLQVGGVIQAFNHDGKQVPLPPPTGPTISVKDGRQSLRSPSGEVLSSTTYRLLSPVALQHHLAWSDEGVTLLDPQGRSVLPKPMQSLSRPGSDGWMIGNPTGMVDAWLKVDLQGRTVAFPGRYSELQPALPSGLHPAREP